MIAADPHTLEVAAAACRELDLPGLDPRAAHWLAVRARWRERLNDSGVAQVAYQAVASPQDAAAAAEALDFPLYVVPASEGMRQERAVEYAADLELALSQTAKVHGSAPVVLESHPRCDLFSLCCTVRAGECTVGAILAHETARAPFRFPIGLSCPADLRTRDHAAITRLCVSALDALEIDTASVKLDLILDDGHPKIVDIDAGAPWTWAPVDLAELAGGAGSIANALRLAVGDAPIAGAPSSAGAVHWMTTRSGEVTGIEGFDEASAVEGVVFLRAIAQTGDMMRHVLDPASRDRVGYAAAGAPDAETARARAGRAAGLCRIVTQTLL